MNAEAGSGPTPLRGRRTKAEFAPRMRRMRELIGYGAADELVVRGTRDVVLEAADEIAGRVYGRIMDHPETRAYFTGADGHPDAPQISMRAETLAAWLRLAVELPPSDELATTLASIGRAHTKRGGSQEVRVSGRYLVGMISVVVAEVADVLTAALPPEDALRAAMAWQRLLTIHLDMFLAVYGSAEGNPHWY